MKILEERIRACSEKHKKAGVELHATCHICLKTKFADGVGHICNYCSIRCCARCGGKVTLRSTKVGERSGKKRQDILSGGIEPSPRSNSPHCFFFSFFLSFFYARVSRPDTQGWSSDWLIASNFPLFDPLSLNFPRIHLAWISVISHRTGCPLKFPTRYLRIDIAQSTKYTRRLRIFPKLPPIFESFKRVTLSFFLFLTGR